MTTHQAHLDQAAKDARRAAAMERIKARAEKMKAIRPLAGQTPLIERLAGDMPYAQWASNALTDRLHPLHSMMARHSGLSWRALVENTDGYNPTLDCYDAERECIADAFDALMIARGIDRRAYRTGWRPASGYAELGEAIDATTGQSRPVWFGVVHDDRQPLPHQLRYIGYWEDERMAYMQARCAAARLNRKAEQVRDVAEEMVEAETLGMTLVEYRQEAGL